MNRLTKYINDTAGELKHVRWLNKEQATTYTALVIGISLIVGGLVAVFDKVFTSLLTQII